MKKLFITLISLLLSLSYIYGQSNFNSQNSLYFLDIPVDARSSGMGDVGVATSSDIYSHQHNSSKYLFGNTKAGVALSYSPWLRELVKDMSITGINGFYVIDSLQSFSGSFRYFSLGDMTLTGDDGTITGKSSPYQLAVDASYSRKLSAYFGMGIGFRYIHSSIFPKNEGYKKGNAVSFDITSYYKRNVKLFNKYSELGLGATLNNIGTKVSYKSGKSDYLPMAFKLGASLSTRFEQEHRVMLTGELTRVLVPTDPDDFDDSVFSGMFKAIEKTSWRSIIWALGAEYSWNNILFGRMGYYHQSIDYGYRQYLTFGVGGNYNIVHLDISYLVPTNMRHNALANTLRFSIAIDIAK